MTTSVSESRWAQVSAFVAGHMGLHFPPNRWRDLERGLAAVARERALPDVDTCIDWLLSAPLRKSQIEILASHLTVGETYFFREQQTFQILEERILPELVRSRRGIRQQLRFWSAGCATGEEPYSLAIALRRSLPDWQDWQVTILATDINPGFLEKASQGTYKDWSFRQPPPGIQQTYFRPTRDGRWEVLPAIKEGVTFSYLNLAEDVYPSLLNNTNAMDVIFCRNVLMYFSPERARQVIRNLHHSLVEGGWLVVAPVETSHVLYPEFAAVNFPGAVLYRKTSQREQPVTILPSHREEDASKFLSAAEERLDLAVPTVASRQGVEESPLPREDESPPTGLPAPGPAAALKEYEQGRYGEAEGILMRYLGGDPEDAAAMALLARAHANQGQLAEALHWCDRAILTDKLNAGWHYLRATILQEQGALQEAARSLSRALYLDPNFILAYFALGHLALRQGQTSQATKHFRNALSLLRSCSPDLVLPESEGTTAGRLMEIIQSVCPQEATA